MEGVDYSYNEVPCLDSLNIFDEYGFQYFFDLRPGRTYSANGSSNAIESVIKTLAYNKKRKIYKQVLKGGDVDKRKNTNDVLQLFFHFDNLISN